MSVPDIARRYAPIRASTWDRGSNSIEPGLQSAAQFSSFALYFSQLPDIDRIAKLAGD